MNNNYSFSVIFLSIFLITSISAAENQQNIRQGSLVKKSNLRLKANSQSKIITSVKANESITIYQRKRAWYEVSTAQEVSGWIRMLNVRFSGVEKREGEIGVSAFISSINNDTLPTVSTGVRGFDDEDLKKAQANMEQVALLDNYAVTTELAIKFAKQGKLQTKAGIYLVAKEAE